MKHVIFNESRKNNTHKYKVLNQNAQMMDRKYSIKCFSLPNVEEHIDFSVLKPFEYSVYLSQFEPCKSISLVAREHNVSRYVVERTLIEIKNNIKKQL